ncbi:GntR family transcriptional regulator [Microbacterium phosphatis]|uniref:GntR family transcriptional regulator n=1 Tax=Microbacterium phosphatis TaxID=3140248 RepID=UPI003140063B
MTVQLAPVTVQATRLAEIVFERVAGAILDGTLAPGSIVRDNAIAAQLGVSRMPVREALQRLQRIGLIDMAASRYTRVAEVTPEIVQQTLEFAACQASSIVVLVVPRLDAEGSAAARAVVADVLAEIDGGAHAVATAQRVYRHLGELSGNRYLNDLLSDVHIAVEHNLRQIDDGDAVRAHVRARLVALEEAISRGDAEAAARIAAAQHDLGELLALSAD